jgi:uncharacterized protein YdeI (YjbR/CyaY-like superfamily)
MSPSNKVSTENDLLPVASPDEFEQWLKLYGKKAGEVWLVIYKKSSGKQTVTYDQLLEVGLCYGWIDNKEKGIDTERYSIRFTPRRANSNWSDRNLVIARRLLKESRMRKQGQAVLPESLKSR